MTPQELKNSILQLAIQGKLVPQDASEGTGEKLYKQIQKEKAALIKEGKIKNGKSLSEITEEEIPFDIPDSWKWVRLNEVGSGGLGKTLNKSTDKGELSQYLCSINVYWEGISLDVIKEARFTEKDKAKFKLEKGDLLICEGGDAGRCAIWNDDRTMYYQNALHRVRFFEGVSPEYIRNVFELYKSNGIVKKHCKGETISHLVQNELYSILFPLPPLAEQKRIVAKIEELLPLVDRYKQAWTKLEDFNRHFPMDMQKSILQMAIQGKLVPQDVSEGTGEELYRQIQKEKTELIKEGKIKKGKPLPEITDEETPFDIPDNWKWVRLGDCSTYAQPKTKISPSSITPDLWSLDLEDIEKETGRIIHYCKASERRITGDKVCFYKGQILYSKLRPYLKKILIAPDSGICTPELVPFDVYGEIYTKYINYVLRAPFTDYIINSVTYGVKMPRVGTATMVNLLIPLPPLAEQKRIVTKIEELLPFCEKLIKV